MPARKNPVATPARRAARPAAKDAPARHAAPDDSARLIHEPMRLAVVSALAGVARMSFGDLKNLLGTSDGNLSVHARKLEEAGYVECTKRFEGRVPRTEFRLTPEGRRALERYLNHMEALIRAARADGASG